MLKHDWRTFDAEHELDVRIVDSGHVQLKHTDETIEDLTWHEFDAWRQAGGDDDG